jgi:hypothetical protein
MSAGAVSILHLVILRTLPLSGRQEAIAIEADSTAACPLEGLVRSLLTGSARRSIAFQAARF